MEREFASTIAMGRFHIPSRRAPISPWLARRHFLFNLPERHRLFARSGGERAVKIIVVRGQHHLARSPRPAQRQCLRSMARSFVSNNTRSRAICATYVLCYQICSDGQISGSHWACSARNLRAVTTSFHGLQTEHLHSFHRFNDFCGQTQVRPTGSASTLPDSTRRRWR